MWKKAEWKNGVFRNLLSLYWQEFQRGSLKSHVMAVSCSRSQRIKKIYGLRVKRFLFRIFGTFSAAVSLNFFHYTWKVPCTGLAARGKEGGGVKQRQRRRLRRAECTRVINLRWAPSISLPFSLTAFVLRGRKKKCGYQYVNVAKEGFAPHPTHLLTTSSGPASTVSCMSPLPSPPPHSKDEEMLTGEFVPQPSVWKLGSPITHFWVYLSESQNGVSRSSQSVAIQKPLFFIYKKRVECFRQCFFSIFGSVWACWMGGGGKGWNP